MDQQEEINQENRKININEVTVARKELKNGKVAGPDEMLPELIKCEEQKAIEWLREICNMLWKKLDVASMP